MSRIPRTVWILSLVSLFTDLASEMLYPIMPVYLKSIGFSVLFIGILEGLADAVAGLSKGYFGHWSDRVGKRLPFVQAGYALSALSKPLLGLFTAPLWVFSARTMDRFGKGLRTAARDAMLSDEATAADKGKIFGFHRAMDTVGAIGGPALALVWLYFYPQSYKALFFIAFGPGIISVLLTFLAREKSLTTKPKSAPGLRQFFTYRKKAGIPYRKVSGLLILFALFNSSDVFLLLRAKESGFSDSAVIGFYIFYNLLYALAAYPMGRLADKAGMRKIMLFGLFVFFLVYLGFASPLDTVLFYPLFALYGIFAAATEGIAKAWISNLCRKEDTATAIGSFLSFQSLALLFSSLGTGLIWWIWGPAPALLISSLGALLIAVLLYTAKIPEKAASITSSNS